MMKFLPAHFGLPLLEKELIEQAARKRTYIVRVVYASILFLVAYLVFYETLRAGEISPLAVLGRGRDMFNALVYLQFGGIYLFMPAITCGVITQEKERDSLQLLFITRLGPWTILFEKLLGRIVPMLCFLLLSLPLLGFAYSLGGISPQLLWTGVWMLVLAVFQMGTLALLCSAFFRTTVGAFIASYISAFLLFFGPYFTWMVLYLVGYLMGIDFESVFRNFPLNVTPGTFILGAFPFFGPPFFLALTEFPGGLGAWTLVGHSAIILATSGVCLLLARRCIVSRAFLAPQNVLRDFFSFIDRRRALLGVKKQLPALASGAPRCAEPETDVNRLPADEPIAWREMKKRLLGRPRYLFRILLFTELPLLLFCFLLVATDLVAFRYSEVPRILVTMALLLLWGLAVLVISVQASSLIAGERSHQTLEVLCTSPLSGREIVLQKFRGVKRLILLLVAPFLTLSLCEAWLRVSAAHRQTWTPRQFDPRLYLLISALSVAVYLPLVAWMSLAIGLKVRTQARAMIGSMAAIAGWCVAPFIAVVLPLGIILSSIPGSSQTTDIIVKSASFLSPVTIVFVNEVDSLDGFLKADAVWIVVILLFAIYGIALVAFRTLCLQNADRWLGRTEQK